MIIRLDTTSDTPIYVQLRNEIVMGIGRGALKIGDALPPVRQMASDIGINHMTVNKAYGILKQEGFIDIDRRHGAVVRPHADRNDVFREKMKSELELLVVESALKGIEKTDFIAAAGTLFDRLNINALSAKA